MKRAAMRTQSEDLRVLGYPRQWVYLDLGTTAGTKEEVAEVVRYLTTGAARSRYRGLQQLLLTLIVILATLQVFVLLLVDPDIPIYLSIYKLAPLSSILLGIAVHLQRGDVQQGAGTLALIGCFAKLSRVSQGRMELRRTVQWASLLAIGVLTFYQYRKLYLR